MNTPTITKQGLWNGRLMHFAALPSTNSWAIENAALCTHGDIILADDQTAGRGRFERKWASDEGRSLTLSFIIDTTQLPAICRENYAQIAALAVWQLLRSLQIEAWFKWPNDIMTSRGKICGILAESISDTSVVVGLGINVAFEPKDSGIPAASTSIHRETSRAPTIPDLRRSLSNCLETAFDDCSKSGLQHLLAIWRTHDYLKGKTITLTTPSDKFTGRYAGIDENGLLLAELDGEIRQFHSGDVTLSGKPSS